MISAGNDIVSFAEISLTKTTQPAFYKKFLTDTDLAQYPAGGVISFGVFIWLLWSVKEAAFKYLKRADPQLVFSPSKFIVGDIKPAETDFWGCLNSFEPKHGDAASVWRVCVTIGKTQLTALSSVDVEYVHSVICPPDGPLENYWAVEKITDASTENQSAEVRRICLDKLNLLKPGAEFKIIISTQGVPSIYEVSEKTTHPVSFSHHGHFIAYMFAM